MKLTYDELAAKLAAAERAREEACGLLQSVKYEGGTSQALFDRIAAFIAANGGRDHG